MYVDFDNPSTAPDEAVVSTEDAKLFLRVDADTEDDLIDEFVSAATKQIQTALGQQLVTATYDGYLNAFPAESYIEIPRSPLTEVESVKYYDAAGDLQTWSSDNYSVDTTRRPGRINLGYGVSWPTTYAIPNAVVVSFSCGYGEASDVPENIVLAMKRLIHEYYQNRGPTGEMPSQVYRLLSSSAHGEL